MAVELAVRNNQPEWGKALEMRDESRAADRVKNQIYTRTAGQLPRTFGHVFGPRIDRTVGAQ